MDTAKFVLCQSARLPTTAETNKGGILDRTVVGKETCIPVQRFTGHKIRKQNENLRSYDPVTDNMPQPLFFLIHERFLDKIK